MRIEDGPIRRITFDRPDARNAMTAAVAIELAEGLEGLDSETHDAVVITGEGDAFSAGGDIAAMAERDETSIEAYERVRATLGRVAERVLTAPVPVVAKVNGDAVGAGLSLVAVSDFAYAAESARFGAAFVNVGLIPDMAGTAILPRLIGLRKTKELVFSGNLITAEEAQAIGLINKSTPAADLDDRVDSLVDQLQRQPTQTIALAKRAIHDNLGRSWRDGLDREAYVQSLAYGTDAHDIGVSAFLNGNHPDFTDQ